MSMFELTLTDRRYFVNGSGHEVPACYLQLHEKGEVKYQHIIGKITGHDSHIFEESRD